MKLGCLYNCSKTCEGWPLTFLMKENANQTVTLIMVKKKWSYRGGKGGSIWRKFSLHCFFFFFFYCLEKKRLHLYKPMLCWQLQNCGINCLLLYSQLSSGVSHGLSTLSTANCNVQLKKKKKTLTKVEMTLNGRWDWLEQRRFWLSCWNLTAEPVYPVP